MTHRVYEFPAVPWRWLLACVVMLGLGYYSAVRQYRQCLTVNPESFTCPAWVKP